MSLNDRTQLTNSDTISLKSDMSNRWVQVSKHSTQEVDNRLPDIVCDKNILSCHKSISTDMLMDEDDNRGRSDFHLESRKKLFDDSMESIQERLDSEKLLMKSSILENKPNFGLKDELTIEDVQMIKEYLSEAFKDIHHPLGVLLSKISKCFYFSYGHWNNKKPAILTTHALDELESISMRVYDILRMLFPALPEDSLIVEK